MEEGIKDWGFSMLPIKGKYPGKSKSRFLNVSFFNTITISSKTSIKVDICTQSSTPQFRLEISKLRTLRKILFSSKSNLFWTHSFSKPTRHLEVCFTPENKEIAKRYAYVWFICISHVHLHNVEIYTHICICTHTHMHREFNGQKITICFWMLNVHID